MRSPLHDFAFVQDQNLIRRRDGGESMTIYRSVLLSEALTGEPTQWSPSFDR